MTENSNKTFVKKPWPRKNKGTVSNLKSKHSRVALVDFVLYNLCKWLLYIKKNTLSGELRRLTVLIVIYDIENVLSFAHIERFSNECP